MNQELKFVKADYIWLDGAQPTQRMRSKVKVLPSNGPVTLSTFEEWGFDGFDN